VGASIPSVQITVACLVEAVVVLLGTIIAFWVGYAYVISHLEQSTWPQNLLGPALNYACTGHLGPLVLVSDPTAADLEAMGHVSNFLNATRHDLPCDLFPHHLQQTSLLRGLEIANVEQPVNLILLYAMLWRLLGPSWTATYLVIASVLAASFLVIYFCLRRFTSAAAAAAVTLIFISSPFVLTNVLSPRDAAKLPFAVAISALLICFSSRSRPPLHYCRFAALIGLLIGIGYGFRSDLMLFLIPATFIISCLGRVMCDRKNSTATKLGFYSVGIRTLAGVALLLSFVGGGFAPLVNDYVLHKDYADVGYHPLAMGLLGHSRRDLYQSHGVDGMYMYRNKYNSDLAIGFRVMEQAARRYGEDIGFATGPYWTYSKRYYLDLVKIIPADLVSGAIGGFVNLMTVPRNFYDRHTLAAFDHTTPWTHAYSCGQSSTICGKFARLMDRTYSRILNLSPGWLFAANCIVLFMFVCLIAERYGFRSAVAAIVLLGAAVSVTSLKFEMRHMFYLYVVPLAAWTAVADWAAWALVRHTAGKMLMKIRSSDWSLISFPCATKMSALTAGLAALILATLWLARLYQVPVLRALIADLMNRPSINAAYEITERGPGLSMIRILSAMPLSTGGVRAADAPAKSRVEMSVVAIEFDGNKCPDRLVTVSSVSNSAAQPNDGTFLIHEEFALPLRNQDDYIAFLPVFNYLLGINGDTTFAGIEIENANVPCVKTVKLVSEFKKEDALFDFFTPKNPQKISADDLYERVYLPGVGFI
jgi:hypothetical protein